MSVGTGGKVHIHFTTFFMLHHHLMDYSWLYSVFNEVKIPPRVGWDGVVSQILDSATDAEQIHHVLEVMLSTVLFFSFIVLFHKQVVVIVNRIFLVMEGMQGTEQEWEAQSTSDSMQL